MGNSMGKKRKMAKGQSKKHKIDVSYVVPMTSSSLQNIVVEFPKEIEEDLERRKIESFKALTGAGSKKGPARTTSAPVFSSTDDFYGRARGLDLPAVMVPKPWSEVDQILSQLKTGSKDSSSQTPKRAGKLPEAQQPETIDMSELMDDLDEEDENEAKMTAKKEAELVSPTVEIVKAEDHTPRPIRSLESSLSFKTIHTVKEVDGGHAKPETVTNFLKSRSSLDSSARTPAGAKSASGAIAPTTPRKVNVNPRLLARMEAFM